MKFIVKGKVQKKTVDELNKFPYNIILDTGTFIKLELILVKSEFEQVQEGQECEIYVYSYVDKLFGFLSETTRARFIDSVEENPSTPVATIYKGMCTSTVSGNVVEKILQETIESDITQALTKLGYELDVINKIKSAFKERYGSYPNRTLTPQEYGLLIKKHIELISELSKD